MLNRYRATILTFQDRAVSSPIRVILQLYRITLVNLDRFLSFSFFLQFQRIVSLVPTNTVHFSMSIIKIEENHLLQVSLHDQRRK